MNGEARRFLLACQLAVDLAKKHGCVQRVYRVGETTVFYAHPEYRADWLFKAWPGGRKELSLQGTELLKINNVSTKETETK